MFYVQHLLGVGHLKRASLIAEAMAAAGLDVAVVLGGPQIRGVEFRGCARILLPAVRAADPAFAALVNEQGEPVDDALRDARASRLLSEFGALSPDVLLIEQFPFGRRQFRFELMPLLETARTAARPPRIVSSVRDVLVRKDKPDRNAEMASLARTWFDRVLVHGDPALITLDQTFPEMETIAPIVEYTGYVADQRSRRAVADREAGRGEVVVSVGGGAVGEPLLRAALAARPLTRLADRPWRLIAGPNLPDEVFDRFAWDAPPGVIVERWRDDLPTLLRNCVLSLSQAGYNTIMDIVQARARAVVVPFAEGDQTEQALRARTLAERGVLGVVEARELTPERLAQALDAAMDREPALADVDVSGAETTARIIASLCGEESPEEA